MGCVGADLLRCSDSGDSHLLFSAIENLLLSVKFIFHKKNIGSPIASQCFWLLVIELFVDSDCGIFWGVQC